MASGIKSAISYLFGTFFLLFLFLIGIYGVFSRIGTAIDASERLAKAERVPAVITEANTNERKTSKGSSFTPWVHYKLSYNGKEYSPDYWRLYDEWHPNVNTKEEADAVLRPYEVGKTVEAYLYPEDPSKSFLDPSNPNVFIGFYVSEVCFAGLAFFAFTCLIANAGIGIRKLRPSFSLSERAIMLPGLISWAIFSDAMMIWYWTHTPPPHSWGSYAWFAIPLGAGLLALLNWNAYKATLGACYDLWWWVSPYVGTPKRTKDKSAGK